MGHKSQPLQRLHKTPLGICRGLPTVRSMSVLVASSCKTNCEDPIMGLGTIEAYSGAIGAHLAY